MGSANEALRQKDGGRSQRGLLVIAASLLFWVVAVSLGFYLF
jgi:hypothetical protein